MENGLRKAPSATILWYKFTDFMTDFDEKRKSEGFEEEDIYEMPIPEYIDFIKNWIEKNEL